jgi:ribose 5-phosphate isomerase B
MASILIGNDAKSITHKEKLIEALTSLKLTYNDIGTNDMKPIDYPDIAMPAIENVLKGYSDFAVIISENGNEMALSALKTEGIMPAVCRDPRDFAYARQKLNANFFCIRNDYANNVEDLREIVQIIATTEFDEGVHSRRLEMIGYSV